jgi:tetratricopeptide (TPR) repeat protein
MDSNTVTAANLVSTQLDAEDTLRMVGAAFGVRVKDVSKADLLMTIEAFLVTQVSEGKRTLLIVDEAQNLTPRAVEELRMLSNFQFGKQALANAGSCAYRAGRDRTAELNFRAALGLAPTQAQSLTGMAQLEHRRGDVLKARAFLQRREALAPLGPGELALGIEIETAAGDDRAAERYRKQLADLAGPANAAGSSSGPGASRR